MRPPLNVKLDYLTLTLDLANETAKAAASRVYEQECGASLRDLRLMRFIAAEPGLTLGRLIDRASLEIDRYDVEVFSLLGEHDSTSVG